MDERYIASIDLGTSKFGLCVARVKGDDVQVVYYKETPSAGIRASVVQNPMKASAPLKKAIEEAENELMIKILQVVVGMPRSDVRQETATGGIVRSNPDEYISEEEVESLKAMALESYPLEDVNSQIMYGAVAQSFSIDDQIQLVENDVVGTLSSALEGNFKVFIGSRRAPPPWTRSSIRWKSPSRRNISSRTSLRKPSSPRKTARAASPSWT